MSHVRLLVIAVFASRLFVGVDAASGKDLVHIIHGKQAPKVERLAATELADILQRVFKDVEVTVSVDAKNSAPRIFVGNPATNPQIKSVFKNWPRTSDQGIVIRLNTASGTHVVGGGSPAATLWAVYELGHRLGIRYLPRGDIDPQEKRPFQLANADVVLEPQLKSRTWRTINDFAIGPESWGLAEHKRFLRQLAKMKFNRLMLSVYPWQPFVRYEFGGVQKQTALHWFGEEYRVDGDTVGKKVFFGKKLFENPDFEGLKTSDERHAAGRKHFQGLIDAAHELGMTVGVSISPLEFPREFQPALPDSKVAHQLKNLTITPASKQGPEDPVLRRLVATKIRAYLETYPQLDTLYLTLPEFPEWMQHADAALKLLRQHGVPADVTVAKLVKTATDRKTIASGKRGEQALRGNIVGLAFFAGLFADGKLLKRADGRSVELVITQVDPALYPILDRVVPKGAATLNFVDYTSRRVVENRKLLVNVPADKVRSQLITTLADDNVGVLPQSALKSIGKTTSLIKTLGWDGFSTRYWVPAELDPAVYFLSQSAWTKDVTAESSFKELWTTATGNPSAVDRLWLAWEHLENATNLIDKKDLGFAFPVPGLLMKHYQPQPIPAWWKEAEDAYTQYMIELYRAHGAINGGAKPMLFYYAKRGEYVLQYLAAVKAVRTAAIAKKAGDTEKALEQLELAIEQTYNCIDTLSDVARDQSDRGLIAVLNAYAYRPLLAEYNRLADE